MQFEARVDLVNGRRRVRRRNVDVLECRGRVAWRGGVVALRGRLGAKPAKARCVGRGLTAELGEVQVGASLVAVIHRLVKTALGPVAVKDDAVEGDADGFDDDFDDDADESPVLDKGVSGGV